MPLGESEQGDECELWIALCALRAPRYGNGSSEEELVADAVAAWVNRKDASRPAATATTNG